MGLSFIAGVMFIFIAVLEKYGLEIPSVHDVKSFITVGTVQN
jgi:hypothetical protein